MEDKFEKELVNIMQKDIEISLGVRKSLDNTYNVITKKGRSRRKRLFTKRSVAVACSFLIVGVLLLSNETVRAVIKPFLNFGDKGIEKVVDEGLVQQNGSSAIDKNIRVTLDNYFYDSNKFGMSFKLNFDDRNILEGDIENIELNYRIKNGNGEYIDEDVSDEEPLKGNNDIISSISQKNPIIDVGNGEVQCDLLLESTNGKIPKLENADIEIESINIFYKQRSEETKIIYGTWNLPLDSIKEIDAKEVEYSAVNNNSKVEILNAKASPTSFNISFTLDISPENSKALENLEMKLANENGEVYNCNGWDTEEKNGKEVVTTNFPVSSLEDNSKYKLILSKIGEYNENNKFNMLIPDTEIELMKK